MSIFDNIRRRKHEAREEVQSEQKDLGSLGADLSTVFADRLGIGGKLKASEYLKSASGWVYGAVNVIADEMASIELFMKRLKNDGDVEEIDDHPVLDLINKANTITTKFDLIKLTFNYLELTGEAPWYISYKNNQPDSIILLRPDRLTIKPPKNADEVIGGYTYRVYGTGGAKEIDLEVNEVIPLRYPDPDSPLRGKGPLQAVAETYDLDKSAEKWNTTFYKNSAMPAAALQTDKILAKDVRSRLEKKLKENHEGVDNAHKTLILESGLKWENLSLSQKDMDFIEQQRFSRDKILAVFRVPRTALGITDDVNRANAEATDYVFAKRTIKPKMTGFVAQLNEFLIPLFKNTDSLYLDFEDPVPENVDQKILKANSGIQSGYMTINEARELVNLDPLEGGDVLLNPMDQQPLQGANGNALSFKGTKKNKAKRAMKQLHAKKTRQKNKINKFKKAIEEHVASQLVPIIYNQLKQKSSFNSVKNVVPRQPIFTAPIEERKKLKYAFQDLQLKAMDDFEDKMFDDLNKVFAIQKAEALKKIDAGETKIKFDTDKYTEIYQEKMKTTFIGLLREQSNLAFQLLGVEKTFGEKKAAGKTFLQTLAGYFEQRTFKVAPQITRETNDKLGAALAEGVKKEESIPQLKSRISELFDDMESYRSERIARSEVTRGSSFATEEAYKKSGVVEAKEWLATRDERTDDECIAMDGKTFPLGETIFDKGDKFEGLSFDYEAIKFPPLHVNCRCTLIPVIGTVVPNGEWQPKMNEAQANEFIKDSKVKETFYHGTVQNAADNITKNGFNLNATGGTGADVVDGVYLTDSVKKANEYAITRWGVSGEGSVHDAVVLSTKVNVKNVKRYTGEQLFDEMYKKFGANFSQDQVAGYLKAQGVDAIIVDDKIMGKFMTVLNPKNVVVTAIENASLPK